MMDEVKAVAEIKFFMHKPKLPDKSTLRCMYFTNA